MSYGSDLPSSRPQDLYGLRRPRMPSIMPPFLDFGGWDECFGYVDEYGEWQHFVRMRPLIRPLRRRPVRRPLITRFKRGIFLRLRIAPSPKASDAREAIKDSNSDDGESSPIFARCFGVSIDPGRPHRDKAKEETKKFRAAMSASRKAAREGNHALAQEKKALAFQHRQRADAHNKTAAQKIFEKKNFMYGVQDFRYGLVDLHGLFVVEAEAVVVMHICNCKLANLKSTIIVTGKGLHSEGGCSRLKPAVLALLEGIPDVKARVNEENEGQVVVHFLEA